MDKNTPTFKEFVENLLMTEVKKFNKHWLPYYMICTPCHHHYSFIIHLENIEEETTFLADATGIQELIPNHRHRTATKRYEVKLEKKTRRESLLQNQNESSTNKRDATFKNKEALYYSQLSLQQLLKLYEVYRIDMEMFDFDLSPYDSYVQQDTHK